MPSQSTNLFLLQDLENSSRTSKLADSDLSSLHSVADWIKTFVARPNKDLGRAGPVCPFVPGACERKTLGSLRSGSPTGVSPILFSS
jgi:hypothetical protein